MGYDKTLAVAQTTAILGITGSTLKRPAAGSEYFRGTLNVRNGRGEMDAPDAGAIYLRIVDTAGVAQTTVLYDADAGTELPAQSGGTFDTWRTQATALGAGRFEFFVRVDTGDTEAPYTLEAGYIKNGTDVFVPLNFRVGDAADLDDIKTEVDKIGVPALASVSLDVAATKAAADGVQSDLDNVTDGLGALKALIDAVQVDLGNFSASSNLGTALALLGTVLDGESLPFATLLAHFFQLYRVESPGAGTGSFTLTAITGGPAVVAGGADDFYNKWRFFVVRGTDQGLLFGVGDYDGTTKVLTTSSGSETFTAGDLLVFFDPFSGKIGSQGDDSTRDTLFGLMGQPGDAAVSPGNEGSIFAYLYSLALRSATQQGSFTTYPFRAFAEVIDANPTEQEISVAEVGNEQTYEVLFKHDVNIQEGVRGAVTDIYATLKWSTNCAGGGVKTGTTKWMLSTATEVVGTAPSVSAVDITDELSAVDAPTTHNRAGKVPSSAIAASGDHDLILVGKNTDAGDTITCTGFDSTKLALDYKVTA